MFKKITYLTFLRSVFFGALITLTFATDFHAQATGSAAKGGSLGRERVKDQSNNINIPETVKYRSAVKNLNINDDMLIAQYKEAQENGKKIKLKEIILGYLIARELKKTDVVGAVDDLILSLQTGKSFDRGIEEVFSLTRKEAQNRKRAAEIVLKKALKNK